MKGRPARSTVKRQVGVPSRRASKVSRMSSRSEVGYRIPQLESAKIGTGWRAPSALLVPAGVRGSSRAHKTCIVMATWYTSLVSAEHSDHDAIRVAATASDRLLRAESVGVQPWAMTRMVEAGVIERVVAGVYVAATCDRHPLIEAAAWTLRHPSAVVCLLTTANQYQLTDAFTRGTWLFAPKGSTVPRSRTAPLEVVQVAPRLIDPEQDEENGITRLLVHGVDLRLTNADRTVLDLWKYPRRVPSEHALTALRRRVKSPDFELPRFARLGRHLGMWRRIEPVLQGMMIR
jgi:hypothetical protein